MKTIGFIGDISICTGFEDNKTVKKQEGVRQNKYGRSGRGDLIKVYEGP
jgi:hypothetical protein